MALGISQKDIQNFEQSNVTAVIPPVTGGEVALANMAVPFQALASGAASVYGALGTAATSTVASLLPSREQMFMAADMGMPPPMDMAQLDPDEMRKNQAVAAAETVREFAPDPRRTGTGAQILHGLVSGGVRFVGGTVLTGSPFGGAALVGATEGVGTRNELIANGVDIATADKLGAGSGLFAGAAAMLPGGFGKTLATRVATGTAAQTSLGVVQRGMMSSVLSDAGYTEQAAQYKPLDGAAMMADAVLGATFGLIHHAFAPAAVDSAHVVKDASQIERSALGIPEDAASRNATVDNNTKVAEALMRGDEQPADTADVHTVRDPAQDATREASAKATQDAGAEIGAKPVEAPEKTFDDLNAELEKIREQVRAAKEAPRAAPAPEGEAVAPAPATEAAAPVLDPTTSELVGQAQEVLSRREGMQLGSTDEEGNPIKTDAAAELQRELAKVGEAKAEGELYKIGAACFGRG